MSAGRFFPSQIGSFPGFQDSSPVDACAVPIGQREAEDRDRVEAEQHLEWSVVRRAWQLNTNHASQAWENRFRMPFSAHALAFLFHQPDGRGGKGKEVKASTKAWLAGVPDAGNPVRLIGALIGEIEQQLKEAPGDRPDDHVADVRDSKARRGRRASAPEPSPAWDFRTELCDRSDDGMADDAVYEGIVYSTLDTVAGSFAQLCQEVGTQLEIPGAFCYVSNPSGSYDDHRVLTAERAAARDFGTTTIHTYGALSTQPIASPYPYTSVDLQVFYSNRWPYHRVLNAMWHLDKALRVADLRRRQANSPRVAKGRS